MKKEEEEEELVDDYLAQKVNNYFCEVILITSCRPSRISIYLLVFWLICVFRWKILYIYRIVTFV